MKEWTLYPTISAPMSFQMALDELLFRRLLSRAQFSEPPHPTPLPLSARKSADPSSGGPGGEGKGEGGYPLLRFYYSSEPWVTVGYSYRNGDRPPHLNPPPAERGEERRGVGSGPILPVCRRITGGGRVEHGKDLIFSLIAGKMEDDSFRSVRVSYWKIHEAVAAGYESLSLKPRFYRCDEPLPRGNECFKFPIASDLAIGNRKIAGGAQKRSEGAFLHQGSLKIPKGIQARGLARAVASGFEKIFSVTLRRGTINPCDLEEVEERGQIFDGARPR